MIKALVILGVFVGACYGIELKPYNFTALLMFHGEDTDMDGCITRLELDTSFDKYDVNGIFNPFAANAGSVITYANSLDPDQTPSNSASHQDPNCDGKESRHEYTTYVCASTPTLYNLSHYLYDEYDVDNDHHLEKHDYDALFAKIDSDVDGCLDEQEFVDYWVNIFTKYENAGTHGHSHENGHSKCH